LKFKAICIVFNLIVLIFLAFFCLLPRFFPGAPPEEHFLRAAWPLILVFFLMLAAFDAFYFVNRRLYFLLEREDWPALSLYLEDRVVKQGHFSPRLVRILAGAYLALADSPAVMSLENKTAVARPGLVEENALLFGTARILAGDIPGAVRFFGARRQGAKKNILHWVRWYHGFALLLDRQYAPAAEEFTFLAGRSGSALAAGLSAFFLSGVLRRNLPERGPELLAAAEEGRARVLKFLPRPEDWRREADRNMTEIHTAALGKYIDEAGRYIYGLSGS
jgi:hypothetical protein